jgi:hypothetical protein
VSDLLNLFHVCLSNVPFAMSVSDAARDIRAKCVGMLKDLDAWDDFSASTDFAKRSVV